MREFVAVGTGVFVIVGVTVGIGVGVFVGFGVLVGVTSPLISLEGHVGNIIIGFIIIGFRGLIGLIKEKAKAGCTWINKNNNPKKLPNRKYLNLSLFLIILI